MKKVTLIIASTASHTETVLKNSNGDTFTFTGEANDEFTSFLMGNEQSHQTEKREIKQMTDAKTQIFDIVAAARIGSKTVNEAANEILSLMDVRKRKKNGTMTEKFQRRYDDLYLNKDVVLQNKVKGRVYNVVYPCSDSGAVKRMRLDILTGDGEVARVYDTDKIQIYLD